MAAEKEVEMRKGPWTEEEDRKLVSYVGLFGQRRWDFVAKVSGLSRTGKSCRLRWLNYLHPGLKHTPMTPEEESLILELHAHWGNRWSRIARKLPGRTDNEIKNFWRTYMRKIARENKRKSASTSSSYRFNTAIKPRPGKGEAVAGSSTTTKEESDIEMTGYPMEKIWDEISGISETITGKNKIKDYPRMLSPQWEDCLESFDTGQDQVEDEDFMALLNENSWFQNTNMENNLLFKYDCVHMTSINKCMICSK